MHSRSDSIGLRKIESVITFHFFNLLLDPWDRRKKKGSKKQKKPAKKRLSTQEKIQSMLVHKSSSNRNKRNGDTAMSGNMGAMGNINRAPPRDAIERACSMKDELLTKIEGLGERLPPNTLDQLIDELGGPENVAEMTGRKGRVVQTEDGAIQYESRSEVDVPLETLNLTEKQRYLLVINYINQGVYYLKKLGKLGIVREFMLA